MTNIPLINFNSGLLSPLIDTRSDVEKYSGGCRTITNMIPRIYGCAERRPGTEYIATAKEDVAVWLVRFQYSDEIAYVCEFGDQYIRFFYDGAVLTGNDATPTNWADDTAYIIGQFVTYSSTIYRCLVAHTSDSETDDSGLHEKPDRNYNDWVEADLSSGYPICETPSPYTESDLPYLQFRQRADVMWIVHPDYAPRKLTRTTEYSFDLSTIDFTNGPFMPRNDLANNDGITITPSDTFSASQLTVDDWAASGGTDEDNVGDDNGDTYWTSAGATDQWISADLGTAKKVAQVGVWAKVLGADGVRCKNCILQYSDDNSTWHKQMDFVHTNTSALETFVVQNPTTHRYWRIWVTDTWCILPHYIYLSEVVFYEAGTITLTASGNVFDPSHVNPPGALFKIRHARENTDTSGTATATRVIGVAIDTKGSFTFNTHGTWAATVQIQRNENQEGWEVYRTYVGNNDRNIQYTGTEKADDVQYRIYVSSYTSGTIEADITVNNSVQDGICRIKTYVSSTVAYAEVLTPLASTDASKRWWEGAWSDYRGYPSGFTFFDERGVYVGSTAEPQNIWLSKSGDPEWFETGTNDNDAFTLTLSSDEANQIRWVSALEALIIGTIGGLWRIRATAMDEALTPTNFNIRQQSAHGTKKLQPIPVGEVILYADYVGRKVREIAFSEDKQKYIAPDLTALAEHITLTGITSMAYQRNPDNILWCVLDDGTLISMVYEREQNVVAWSNHTLGGTDVEVESVVVIPGDTEDEVWISAARTIDGSTARHIERFTARVDVDEEDVHFVDSGLTYEGASTTITGITNADPGVVTVASVDGLSNGNQIYISGVAGMTELNGNYYTIQNLDTTNKTFELNAYSGGA